MSIHDHRQLRAWQLSMQLLVAAYRVAERLPRQELFELSAQLRRAAVSIPANIAEGAGRRSRADYARHLSIANGSLMELQTLLSAARLLEFVSEEELRQPHELIDHVGRMLTLLIRRLRS